MYIDENLKALDDLPKLLEHTGKLVAFTENLLAEPIPYSQEDHMAFMELLYVSQQSQYLKSMRLLVKADLGVSTGLIARAMLESMCFLKWCAIEPSIRPLQWRAFAFVKDFRLMREKELMGETVPDVKITEISVGLQKYGDYFLTRTASNSKRDGKDLPDDPYVKNWPSKTICQICEEVGGSQLYQKLYQPWSELTHGDAASFARQVKHDYRIVYFDPAPPTESATPLKAGFQALLESLELLNSHLQLQKEPDISDLKQQYLTTLHP